MSVKGISVGGGVEFDRHNYSADGESGSLKTKQAGFDEHLTKPVDISMIELLLTQLPARPSQSTGGGPPVENGDTIDASNRALVCVRGHSNKSTES
jgi:hypothetical protein